MKLPPEKYQRSLLVELHRRDVPGQRIGDVLAEVDSHVAETGETPDDAFGPPKQYADTIAGQRLQRGNRTLRIILLAVSGAATGFLLATAIAGLVAGESRYGVPSWLPLVIGVLLAGLTIALARRSQGPVTDPRTGETIGPSQPLAFTLVLGAVLVCFAIVLVIVTVFG